MTPAPKYDCFVGIDIAATTFVAAWAESGQVPTRPGTFGQTEAGFAAFQAQLPAGVAPAQILIAMEATSSYWIRLAVTLHQAGYAVAVLNPKYVKKLDTNIKLASVVSAIQGVSARAMLAARLEATEEAIARLDDIPGVSRRVAEVVLAEIGPDVTRFPTAAQLASWVGLCPGNHQSAGKR